MLPLIDRRLAERYLTNIAGRDLVHRLERWPRERAERVARSFLAPFGPRTWFYPNITLTEASLNEREVGRNGSHAVYTEIFGNTFEEGVFAIDPDGRVGAFFVGEED